VLLTNTLFYPFLFFAILAVIVTQKKRHKVTLLDAVLFLYWRKKKGADLDKQFVKIGFRVTCNMAEMIDKTFNEARKECKRPYISSSRIHRAFWTAISTDKSLRKRVMCALCDFLKSNADI
jgi:hypothetical protein